MPQTLLNTPEGQIIGGVFSRSEYAELALQKFEEFGVPKMNILVITRDIETHADEDFRQILYVKGFPSAQADYYGHALRPGKTLVVVYRVMEPGPIIEIFDKFHAEFNPDGSRNGREDVSGMTAGAVIGAAAGGAIGLSVGGPIGAVACAVPGAVVGAVGGAAVGKAAESHK